MAGLPCHTPTEWTKTVAHQGQTHRYYQRKGLHRHQHRCAHLATQQGPAQNTYHPSSTCKVYNGPRKEDNSQANHRSKTLRRKSRLPKSTWRWMRPPNQQKDRPPQAKTQAWQQQHIKKNESKNQAQRKIPERR